MKKLFKKLRKNSDSPEKKLEKNLKELNEKIPVMNSDISTIKSKITDLNSELDKLKIEKDDFENKKKISLKNHSSSISKNIDDSLKRIIDSINLTEKDLNSIQKNYQKALDQRNKFLEKRNIKITRALSQIKDNDRVKWKEHCQNLMKSFNIEENDITDDENNEYVQKKINASRDIIDLLKNKCRLIPAGDVQDNVNKIISLSEKVIDDLKDHPDHLRKARFFLSYYLEAAAKVVSGYTDLCNEEFLSEKTRDMLENAEKLLKKIQVSFEEFLKKLNDIDALKLDVELKVLEKTLKNSGL